MGKRKQLHPVVVKEPPVKDSTLVNLGSRMGKRVRQQFLGSLTPCSLQGFPYGSGDFHLTKAWKVSGTTKARGSRLFHGTPHTNIGSIVMGGFNLPSHPGMFGVAVYLAPDVWKSLNYTGKNRPEGPGKNAFVLVCTVDLGRIYRASKALTTMNPTEAKSMGIDSVEGAAYRTQSWGGTLRGSEYAVYDPRRIVVTHVLQYERQG